MNSEKVTPAMFFLKNLIGKYSLNIDEKFVLDKLFKVIDHQDLFTFLFFDLKDEEGSLYAQAKDITLNYAKVIIFMRDNLDLEVKLSLLIFGLTHLRENIACMYSIFLKKSYNTDILNDLVISLNLDGPFILVYNFYKDCSIAPSEACLMIMRRGVESWGYLDGEFIKQRII